MRMKIPQAFDAMSGWLRRLVRSEIGSVTVEFVAWMPVFMFVLALTADACKLYLTQADMWTVARDTARRMATGQLATPTDAQNYAKQHLLYASSSYTYTITQDVDDTVEIKIPITDACVFGILPVIANLSSTQMAAKVVMRAESEGTP